MLMDVQENMNVNRLLICFQTHSDTQLDPKALIHQTEGVPRLPPSVGWDLLQTKPHPTGPSKVSLLGEILPHRLKKAKKKKRKPACFLQGQRFGMQRGLDADLAEEE
ncbi:unnamed protein product, partial [Pleuronectes platessa]